MVPDHQHSVSPPEDACKENSHIYAQSDDISTNAGIPETIGHRIRKHLRDDDAFEDATNPLNRLRILEDSANNLKSDNLPKEFQE